MCKQKTANEIRLSLVGSESCIRVSNLTFIAVSRALGSVDGQVIVLFVITLAAAEAAIGLAILVVLFRNLDTIDVEDLDSLKG